MALLLNIDTATPVGSVCLSKDGQCVAEKISTEQKDHAALVGPFIAELLADTGIKGTELDAIAISGGPGSYTGLRVATSTAKGLCYAWQKPLIAVSTLAMMASGIRAEWQGKKDPEAFYCPMIDARRMEVFTALYDSEWHVVVPPEAVVLDEHFLEAFQQRPVLIGGTGMPKAQRLFAASTAWQFVPHVSRAAHLIALAEQAFAAGDFAELAYFEPFYLKSVYLPGASKK